MEKLFIVDALNFIFRSYYAIGPLTNLQGESTSALFGFIRSMNKLIQDFHPHYLIVVFDGPDNKKSRLEIYPEYKSHRTKMPEDLSSQVSQAIRWCQLAGIPYLSVPGVEADDTIGSIALWAAKQNKEVFICSSDKDLCQLIKENIFVINIHKDNLLIDSSKVEEIYGIKPEQVVDYLALVGDTSDNIPGLEGFGPKTTSSLLKQWKTLDAILDNYNKIPGEKKQQILKRDKELALLGRKLARIDPFISFPKDEAFFRFIEENRYEILKPFYKEMNFASLLKELEKNYIQQTNLADNKDYTMIQDLKSLENLCLFLQAQSEICLDTETTDLNPLKAEIVGIGFGVQPHKAWYIPFNSTLKSSDILNQLHILFNSPKLSFYGHNIKYDLHALLNQGLPSPKIHFDTILASYLINPQSHKHSIDQLCLDTFGVIKTPIKDLIGKGTQQLSMRDIPLEKVSNYCCEDVDYTVQLKLYFEKQLQDLNLMQVLRTIEHPLIPILCKMERRGIYVDVKELKALSLELASDIEKIKKEIHALAGEDFNINSPQQLGKILFQKMGIRNLKKNQKAFSTNAQVLLELQHESPIIKKIIDYRALEKLRSTYADSLPLEVNSNTQRIHCTFNQSVAATGRLSCQNPNLQNIPVRSKEGRKIRQAFKPQKEGWSFLSADYSQIELRLLAHLSEDPTLLKAFNEGEDVHTHTASVVFGVHVKDVTPEMRYKAKAVNFGILYGQQAFGLSQGLGIDFKEASRFIKTYFERYEKVKYFFEFCKESARQTGRVITLTGRHRPIIDINSSNPTLRAAAERLAMNTPLQGTAADLIKIAMIQIDSFFEKERFPGFMLLQIHDELIFEAPDESLAFLSKNIKKIMEEVAHLKVPLEVNISIGKNWGEC